MPFSFDWIWIYLVLSRVSSAEGNECHLSILLSLSWLNSKLNQYATFSWITSARKGQTWHRSLSAWGSPHTLWGLLNHRCKAEGQLTFTQTIEQAAWVNPLATMIPSSLLRLQSTMTNLADIAPGQSATPEPKVSDWPCFAITFSLGALHSLVSWLKCNSTLQVVDKR